MMMMMPPGHKTNCSPLCICLTPGFIRISPFVCEAKDETKYAHAICVTKRQQLRPFRSGQYQLETILHAYYIWEFLLAQNEFRLSSLD